MQQCQMLHSAVSLKNGGSIEALEFPPKPLHDAAMRRRRVGRGASPTRSIEMPAPGDPSQRPLPGVGGIWNCHFQQKFWVKGRRDTWDTVSVLELEDERCSMSLSD